MNEQEAGREELRIEIKPQDITEAEIVELKKKFNEICVATGYMPQNQHQIQFKRNGFQKFEYFNLFIKINQDYVIKFFDDGTIATRHKELLGWFSQQQNNPNQTNSLQIQQHEPEMVMHTTIGNGATLRNVRNPACIRFFLFYLYSGYLNVAITSLPDIIDLALFFGQKPLIGKIETLIGHYKDEIIKHMHDDNSFIITQPPSHFEYMRVLHNVQNSMENAMFNSFDDFMNNLIFLQHSCQSQCEFIENFSLSNHDLIDSIQIFSQENEIVSLLQYLTACFKLINKFNAREIQQQIGLVFFRIILTFEEKLQQIPKQNDQQDAKEYILEMVKYFIPNELMSASLIMEKNYPLSPEEKLQQLKQMHVAIKEQVVEENKHCKQLQSQIDTRKIMNCFPKNIQQQNEQISQAKADPIKNQPFNQNIYNNNGYKITGDFELKQIQTQQQQQNLNQQSYHFQPIQAQQQKQQNYHPLVQPAQMQQQPRKETGLCHQSQLFPLHNAQTEGYPIVISKCKHRLCYECLINYLIAKTGDDTGEKIKECARYFVKCFHGASGGCQSIIEYQDIDMQIQAIQKIQ